MRNPFKKMMTNVKLSARTAKGNRPLTQVGQPLKRKLVLSKAGGFYRDHKHHEVDITWKDLEEQFIKQEGCDFYLPGYRIDLNEVFVPHSIKAPSVDRIEDELGYVRGNFVITTRFVNLGRNKYPQDKFKDFLNELLGEPTKIERFF
jgi:hypothetical protein|tara:strand:- start:31 stop:471 length:441 start_codon:yes stop_codon:yes gene_type:complete